MPGPVLDFWFDFASTYSYPAAARIGPLAAEAGVEVRFRPFLLGPIFKAQGWDTSPFNLYPAKGRNMWRDLERVCEDAGLPFRRARAVSAEQPACRARCDCGHGSKAGARRFRSRSTAHSSPTGAGSTSPRRSERSCRASMSMPKPRSRPHSRTTTSCGSARRPRRRSGSACSARRPSSPPAANCSGATTAWSRRCAGPRRGA